MTGNHGELFERHIAEQDRVVWIPQAVIVKPRQIGLIVILDKLKKMKQTAANKGNHDHVEVFGDAERRLGLEEFREKGEAQTILCGGYFDGVLDVPNVKERSTRRKERREILFLGRWLGGRSAPQKQDLGGRKHGPERLNRIKHGLAVDQHEIRFRADHLARHDVKGRRRNIPMTEARSRVVPWFHVHGQQNLFFLANGETSLGVPKGARTANVIERAAHHFAGSILVLNKRKSAVARKNQHALKLAQGGFWKAPKQARLGRIAAGSMFDRAAAEFREGLDIGSCGARRNVHLVVHFEKLADLK